MDFQTWMRTVWNSLMEPSDAARRVIAARTSTETLWTGLALIIVLNVLLIALVQVFSDVDVGLDAERMTVSPFGLAVMFGVFLTLLVLGLHHAGRMIGGAGTQDAALAIIVWFQAISLTLEAIQLILLIISPAVASLFGLLSLGALIWCFVNFVNVLHSFGNLGKAVLAVIIAFIGTALVSGLLLALFGVATPQGIA